MLAFYGAKIEATRRSLPTREIAAAVRAIIEERDAAMRAFSDRQKYARVGLRERRAAERFSQRLAQKNARASRDARPL